MNNEITPPPALFKQWEDDILNERDNVDHVLDCAWRDGFRAGADQELEACCEWLGDAHVVWNGDEEAHPGAYLRADRRPKPPSLKEQALYELESFACSMETLGMDVDTIRRAIESLPS
jgi:hypothetical protein